MSAPSRPATVANLQVPSNMGRLKAAGANVRTAVRANAARRNGGESRVGTYRPGSGDSSVLSFLSPGGVLSAFSVRSILSFASLISIGSSGSILSIGSVGSILSIGSAGSILSIGSVGSILSIGGAGTVLNKRREEADEDEMPEEEDR